MHTLTQLTLAFEATEQGLSHTTIASHLGRHRETSGLWLKGMARYGFSGFLARHTQAKKAPRRARQVPATIQRLIWDLRVRERDCCGKKIAYFLEREYQVRLVVSKIYEILAEEIRDPLQVAQEPEAGCRPEGVLRSGSHPNGYRGVWAPLAFTGIDIYTKVAHVVLRPALTSEDGVAFLQTAMSRRFTGRLKVLQTEAGPEFKGAFAKQARDYCDRHRIARPYKKNE